MSVLVFLESGITAWNNKGQERRFCMANFFSNFINSLHLVDEEEDDEDYEEYVEQVSAREQRRSERKEQKDSRRSYPEDDMDYPDTGRGNTSYISDAKKERAERRTEKQSQSQTKMVSFRSQGNGMGIKVMKPTNFEDSQDICDVLLAGKATIINLEGFNVDLAQRVMDFISGAVYAANGRLHQISNYIFIISPENIDITGDYLDLIKQNGFDVPTITRDF